MDIREKIREEFSGKDVYLCVPGGISGTRLNIMKDDLSFCHEAALRNKPTEVDHICNFVEFTPQIYYRKVYELICKFQKSDFACRECPNCKKSEFSFLPIRFITICTNSNCNSSCIYCSGHTNDNSASNPLKIIEALNEANAIDQACLFDWGGGEPTINPFFRETVKYLSDHEYRQRINTNAIIYSSEAAKALQDKRTVMRISADSGSEEGYYRIKGTKNYEVFWENIRQYCNKSDKVYLKYNVFNENSDIKEIDSFLENCINCGVHHILIDAEISSYQPKRNFGPFYFTKKEFEAAHYLEDKARMFGLDVGISEYAFGVRPERDKEGKLKLPSEYHDNIDRDIINNELYIKTFAGYSNLIEYLKYKKEKIILWGAGNVGSIAADLLRKEGIAYDIIDSNRIVNESIENSIYKANEYLVKLNPERRTIIIITVENYKDILKKINNLNLNAQVLWVKRMIWEEGKRG